MYKGIKTFINFFLIIINTLIFIYSTLQNYYPNLNAMVSKNICKDLKYLIIVLNYINYNKISLQKVKKCIIN